MPDNATKDSYELLLERLTTIEDKYNDLLAKYEDVTSFNRALLSQKNTNAPTTDEKHTAAMQKLEKMLKEE